MRALALSLVLLAACAPTAVTSPVPPPPPAHAAENAEQATAQDACGMARFQHLIGQPAASIDRATLPPRARIITPGMMVTQDFSAERLNIFTGVDGKVSSMRCF